MKVESSAEYATMIRDLPMGERPRERLRELGPRYLSNSELIAILIRVGVPGENAVNLASRLLSEFGGLSGVGRASYGELCEIKGLSDAKACQIMAAMEVGRRLLSLHPDDRPTVASPQDVFNLVGAEMSRYDQEHLRVLLLNVKNQVCGQHDIYKGNVSSASVRVSEVLRPAIRENCPSFIVVHNHPSGDPSPSPEDVLITRQIRTGGEMMDIALLDHIIIGDHRWASLKQRGLGF